MYVFYFSVFSLDSVVVFRILEGRAEGASDRRSKEEM